MTASTRLICYLLHIAPPVRAAQHYLGITTAGRLEQRMYEHSRGRGSSLTRWAVTHGSKLILVRTYDARTYLDERRRKTLSHYRRHCPICNDGADPHTFPSYTCDDPAGLGEFALATLDIL